MNDTFLCFLFAICFGACVPGKKNAIKERPKFILFIGNSLTYYNDMPQTLQKMFDSQHINITVTQCTYPGISLNQHLNRKAKIGSDGQTNLSPITEGDSSATVKTLLSKKWDVVVLQEGTVKLLIPEARNLQTLPSVQAFTNYLKTTKTEFILFKTWPNLDSFPQQSCYPSAIIDKSLTKDMCCSPLFRYYLQECDYINHAYDSVSVLTKMKTVPITNCYKSLYSNYPNINLYKDKVHPSETGSYLIACVFFKQLTEKKASSINYYANIDPGSAEIIHQVVDYNLK